MKYVFLALIVVLPVLAMSQGQVQYLPGRVVVDTLNYKAALPIGPAKDSTQALRSSIGAIGPSGPATAPFDSTSLSNRINQKADSTDRATRSYTIAMLAVKLNITDTASFQNQIALRLKSADTLSLSTVSI
jgi:hypothetical protein